MLTTTRPKLLEINATGPVRVTSTTDPDFEWIVQPENFDSLIEHVNAHGGPDFYRIEEVRQGHPTYHDIYNELMSRPLDSIVEIDMDCGVMEMTVLEALQEMDDLAPGEAFMLVGME